MKARCMTGGHTGFGMRVSAGLALMFITIFALASTPAARADVGLFEDGWAVVAHDGGDGVRIRPNPDVYHGVKTVAPSGTLLKLHDGPFTDKDGLIWFHVTYGNVDGFAQVYYLSPSDHLGNSMGYGIITNTGGDPIRVRSDPNANADILTHVYDGHIYPIVGGPVKDSTGRAWYKINKDWQVFGWMMADYIYPHAAPNAGTPPKAPAPPAAPPAQPVKSAPTPTPPPTSAPEAHPAPPPAPVSNPAPSSKGAALVAYARKYLGYAYVWGGASPKAGGFDCSGFVYWVLTQNGISTGRDIEDEIQVGSTVGRSNLQPGDIVFFVNTYKAGLSHVGIYIGGGQFIHAENEGTGVTISDLNGGYYGSRYFSARRP